MKTQLLNRISGVASPFIFCSILLAGYLNNTISISYHVWYIPLCLPCDVGVTPTLSTLLMAAFDLPLNLSNE
jgi:hypothetical protein